MPVLDAPIILLGSERSGSNLITKIFDAHPEVCAPGASHLFKVMSECACKYPADSKELRRAVLELFQAKVSRWSIDAVPEAELEAVLDRAVQASDMAAALYAEEARAAGKPHVFIKENSVFRYLQFLLGQCARPRFLFMVRDPRDMAMSWANSAALRGGVLRATDRWVTDQAGFLGALPHLSASAPVSFLRYEDLLASPEAEVRRVCEELRLAYSSSMMAFNDLSLSARDDSKRSSLWSNLGRPIMAGNSKKYLSGLSDDEIAFVEAMAGTLMATLGYGSARPDGSPFGGFDTLEALHERLLEDEPHTKTGYQSLDPEERARLERWSRLYARMSGMPPLSPVQLGAGRR